MSRASPRLFVGRVSRWKCKTQSHAEISFPTFVLRLNETFQQLSRLHEVNINSSSPRGDACSAEQKLTKCFSHNCVSQKHRAYFCKIFQLFYGNIRIDVHSLQLL